LILGPEDAVADDRAADRILGDGGDLDGCGGFDFGRFSSVAGREEESGSY
jgi:hypothetical protein